MKGMKKEKKKNNGGKKDGRRRKKVVNKAEKSVWYLAMTDWTWLLSKWWRDWELDNGLGDRFPAEVPIPKFLLRFLLGDEAACPIDGFGADGNEFDFAILGAYEVFLFFIFCRLCVRFWLKLKLMFMSLGERESTVSQSPVSSTWFHWIDIISQLLNNHFYIYMSLNE